MFALEIDEENIKFARTNIENNEFSERITLIEQEDPKSIFKKLFQDSPETKTFCLCNPPFFNSQEEVVNSENRTGKRKLPRSLNSGTQSELIFQEGGELGFVKMILTESLHLKDKIEIYSSMIGCKKNLEKFLIELKARNIGCTTTEFVQGKTMRWGVAWSFKHNLQSFSDHSKRAKKSDQLRNIIHYEFPQNNKNFEEYVAQLRQTFTGLEIDIKNVEEVAGNLHRWELNTKKNTWSNQRRKRRIDQSKNLSANQPHRDVTNEDLQVGFEMRNAQQSIALSMFFISGTMSKDSVNQIMQFIKNRYK